MNENEKNFLSEIARKAGAEAKEQVAACFGINETDPDPDPETERMIAEKEEADNCTPDELLLDAMKSACSLLEEAACEARRSLMSPDGISELLRSASELLRTIGYLHVRVSVQKTTDKLRLMREVEERNNEKIHEWSEKQ